MIELSENHTWPNEAVGEALMATARAAGLPHRNATLRQPPSEPVHQDQAATSQSEQWLEAAADSIGLEANPVNAKYCEIAQWLASCSPALLRLSEGKTSGWLVIVGRRRHQLKIVKPDLSTAWVAQSSVEQAVKAPLDLEHAPTVQNILNELSLSEARRGVAYSVLMNERLGRNPVGMIWLLQVPGHREVKWGQWISLLIGSHCLDQILWIASWWLLGWMAFAGRLEATLLTGWALLLCCMIPFRLLTEAAGGMVGLEFSASLRRRLLRGTLKLDPDEIRTHGTGKFIGRALEVDKLEQLALTGGLQSVLSVIELISAIVILGPLSGHWPLATLLLLIVAAIVAQAFRFWKVRTEWTAERMQLSDTLVERLAGHRTLLAQEPETHAVSQADRSIDAYLGCSQRMDKSIRLLRIVPARLWLITAMIVLSPAFVTGRSSVTSVAVGLAAVLFARQGLLRLLDGLDRVVGAGISWQQLRDLLQAANRPEESGDPDFSMSDSNSSPKATTSSKAEGGARRTVVEARDLTFRHHRRSEPVLHGIDLTISDHDRILLQGSSGGGKSTLAAVLAGSRLPDSGVRLLRGLDQATLGETWRKRIVLVPQFHDNHVFMGSFLFNLLLGRNWPPTLQDATAAERVCRDLQLGPLLDRMPGGLMQMIGETGWQLSHGERSRLFLARALLQKADLLILDESFAALDPTTLKTILPVIQKRAPAMIVIAHP